MREAISKAKVSNFAKLETLPEVKEIRKFISTLPKEFSNYANEQLLKTLQAKLIEDRLKTYYLTIEDTWYYPTEK